MAQVGSMSVPCVYLHVNMKTKSISSISIHDSHANVTSEKGRDMRMKSNLSKISYSGIKTNRIMQSNTPYSRGLKEHREGESRSHSFKPML